MVRLDFAEHDVGVGHGERPAAPVAGRTGVGAGAVRPDAVFRAVEMQDGAAAGRHGVNLHHRRAHPHPGDQGFERALVFAGIVGHVGRGAAHVEADQLAEAGHLRCAHRADDAAGRAGQDRILALEAPRVGEAAVRLHEHQPGIADLVGDPADIAAQDRREVGVDHRGVAAPHQLHQRADLVADRDLGETDVAAQGGDLPFVVGIAIAVHEQDGDRAIAGAERIADVLFGAGKVERRLDRAVGHHPLVDLDDPAVEQFRQHDIAREQARADLVGDAQSVGKAPGDDQQGALALAFEQRVGRDGRAHLHGVDPAGRDRLAGRQAEHVANALDRGVGIALRVFRQQLVRRQPPVRRLGHHVGEGAAPVDPELPAGHGPVR